MTRRARAARLAEMPDPTPIRLDLEIVAWPDPIEGSLRDGHGRERTFHGWMGLAAALAALAGASSGVDHDQPT